MSINKPPLPQRCAETLSQVKERNKKAAGSPQKELFLERRGRDKVGQQQAVAGELEWIHAVRMAFRMRPGKIA